MSRVRLERHETSAGWQGAGHADGTVAAECPNLQTRRAPVICTNKASIRPCAGETAMSGRPAARLAARTVIEKRVVPQQALADIGIDPGPNILAHDTAPYARLPALATDADGRGD